MSEGTRRPRKIGQYDDAVAEVVTYTITSAEKVGDRYVLYFGPNERYDISWSDETLTVGDEIVVLRKHYPPA